MQLDYIQLSCMEQRLQPKKLIPVLRITDVGLDKKQDTHFVIGYTKEEQDACYEVGKRLSELGYWFFAQQQKLKK